MQNFLKAFAHPIGALRRFGLVRQLLLLDTDASINILPKALFDHHHLREL